jgi:hypothetical protein
VEVALASPSPSSLEHPSRLTDYDPFSFGDIDKLHQTYQNMFEWFGSPPQSLGPK